MDKCRKLEVYYNYSDLTIYIYMQKYQKVSLNRVYFLNISILNISRSFLNSDFSLSCCNKTFVYANTYYNMKKSFVQLWCIVGIDAVKYNNSIFLAIASTIAEKVIFCEGNSEDNVPLFKTTTNNIRWKIYIGLSGKFVPTNLYKLINVY